MMKTYEGNYHLVLNTNSKVRTKDKRILCLVFLLILSAVVNFGIYLTITGRDSFLFRKLDKF